MVIVVLLCFGVCAMGLQKGVERITKVMMVCLLVLMVVLAVHSMVLPGGGPGLEFYLKPDFGKMAEAGIGEAVFAALGQSFFTLSIGIGALAIFGSYIGKERTLTGEAVSVTLLDTLVAFMAGLIIFPACFAYNIESTAGPSLIFITLPNVFNHMAGGRIWGTLFFLFMSFAAFSTIIAVFQNIISFATDLTGCTLKKAVLCNIAAIIILSVPCVLGFNLWGSFAPWEREARFWIWRISSSATTFCLSAACFTCCFAPAAMDGALRNLRQRPMKGREFIFLCGPGFM